MSKKIKLIIMLFFLLLGISTTTQAYTPSGFFPQVEGSYEYFCKEKGAPLRFFSESMAENDSMYSRVVVLPQYIYSIEAYEEGLDKILGMVKSTVANKVEKLGANYKAYKITSGTGTNYNGSFNSDPRK